MAKACVMLERRRWISCVDMLLMKKSQLKSAGQQPERSQSARGGLTFTKETQSILNTVKASQEIKRDSRTDLFAATPPFEGNFSTAFAEGLGYENGAPEGGLAIVWLPPRRLLLHPHLAEYIHNASRSTGGDHKSGSTGRWSPCLLRTQGKPSTDHTKSTTWRRSGCQAGLCRGAGPVRHH